MTPVRILGVSGSLREESTNTRLLEAAVRLSPPDVDLHLTSSLPELPAFTPDADPARIPEVDRWVREMRAAEGLVVSTPEYARGYPGALKNAFDWLVGTDAFVEKPFMLLNASARSVIAQTTFTRVLETMSGVHVESASATVPLLGRRLTVPEIVGNPELAGTIERALAELAEGVRRHAEATARALGG